MTTHAWYIWNNGRSKFIATSKSNAFDWNIAHKFWVNDNKRTWFEITAIELTCAFSISNWLTVTATPLFEWCLTGVVWVSKFCNCHYGRAADCFHIPTVLKDAHDVFQYMANNESKYHCRYTTAQGSRQQPDYKWYLIVAVFSRWPLAHVLDIKRIKNNYRVPSQNPASKTRLRPASL